MTQQLSNSNYGFTLVEMTVVLLLITLLATVAVRETAELNYQVRFDQTKERLELIKQAILGNPKQIINGQQTVNGFVGDLGRLPGSLHDLIQPGACTNGVSILPDSPFQCVDSGETWTWFEGLCTVNGYVTQIDCSNAGGVWLGWQVDPVSGLGFGWRGPYLEVSGHPNSNDSFTDAWGRLGVDNVATSFLDESIAHYGWEIMNAPGIYDLTIISYGKDQLPGGNCSGIDFDDDCFLQILAADYQIDISSGITVSLAGRAFNMDSHCSNGAYLTRSDCEVNGAVWYGGCSEGIAGSPSYANKDTCPSGKWSSCSITTLAAQPDCEANGGIWYGDGYGCSDAGYGNRSTCEPAIPPTPLRTWYGCSDNTKKDRAACETASANWYGTGFDGATSSSRQLCLKIYHHANGGVATLGATSTPVLYEDETQQNLIFDFPQDSRINIGKASVALYYQRGLDGCQTAMPYPLTSKPLPITIYPRTSLPTIHW